MHVHTCTHIHTHRHITHILQIQIQILAECSGLEVQIWESTAWATDLQKMLTPKEGGWTSPDCPLGLPLGGWGRNIY